MYVMSWSLYIFSSVTYLMKIKERSVHRVFQYNYATRHLTRKLIDKYDGNEPQKQSRMWDTAIMFYDVKIITLTTSNLAFHV